MCTFTNFSFKIDTPTFFFGNLCGYIFSAIYPSENLYPRFLIQANKSKLNNGLPKNLRELIPESECFWMVIFAR